MKPTCVTVDEASGVVTEHYDEPDYGRVFKEPRGLVATMQKNSDRQQLAKQKGPRARVAKMAVDQAWNSDPENAGKPKREIRPL